MEVTKKQTAEFLNISMKEVVRRIESGELKARKKTSSKFSDWVITLPDHKRDRDKVAKMVTKKIEEKKPKVIEAVITEKKKRPDLVIEEPEPKSEPELESEPKVCSRCGKPVEEGADSDVCGTCADDLRAEEAAAQAEVEASTEELKRKERRDAEEKARAESSEREEGDGKKGNWWF